MGWFSGKGKDKGDPGKHYGGASEVTSRDSNGKVTGRVTVGERGYTHTTPGGKTTGHSNGVSHHHGSHASNGKSSYSGSAGGGKSSGGILGGFFGGKSK